MPAKTDPADRMWLRAIELLGEADRLHRQFFHFSGSNRDVARWAPPVDVFEDDREIVIIVAMPGVAPERVQVTSEPGVLVVRGTRPLPLPHHRVVQLEIPYGAFERRITLPHGPFRLGEPELVAGCLVLRLTRLEAR